MVVCAPAGYKGRRVRKGVGYKEDVVSSVADMLAEHDEV